MHTHMLEVAEVAGPPVGPHLEPNEIAAFVDGATPAPVRARVESHLASCDDCRAEVAEVAHLSLTLRQARRRRRVWIPAAAVAAAVILLVVPHAGRAPVREHREGTVTMTISPRALAPVGLVDSLTDLTWSSVPRAERYHVRLFDADGAVLVERETSDTSIAIPPAVRVRSATSYYWRVEALAGFDRSAASELVAFSVRRARAP
jgi:hypothetical protein